MCVIKSIWHFHSDIQHSFVDHEVRNNIDMSQFVLLCAIFQKDFMTNVTKSGKIKSHKISFAHG